MTRALSASHPVAGSAEELGEILADDPGRWLPAPARPSGGRRWTIDVVAGPLTRSVACRVGAVWRVEGALWRSLLWQPRPEAGDLFDVDRLLPVLRAEIGLTPAASGPLLVLRGSYAPPAAGLGAAADRVAMQHLAQRTVERFLADVAARLSAARQADA